MPTKLTPQGWVKTAPAPRKKQAIQNPKALFRGPLAYLACQPQAPALNVGGNTGGVKGKAPFPYDLSASPEKLRRLGQEAGRTVSAPVMHGGLHLDDDDLHEAEVERGLSPSKSETHSKHKSRSSGTSSRHHHDDDHHHRHHHHHRRDHDNHSVASSTSSGSSSSSRSSGAPSDRSYTRHRPPVDARPPPPPPANHYYAPAPAGPRYEQYMAPPPVVQMPMHMHMPMPPSSGRSLSYSWYNATTPLNI